MQYNTSVLCDIYADTIDVAEPLLTNFGGRTSFAGEVVTVKCFESVGLIYKTLEDNGAGKVLLIDGGGSLRRALVNAHIAELAVENNWEGIVINGCVREIDTLEELDIGVQAITAMPVGADDNDIGETDVPVNFAGVTFLPEDFLYADSTGIVISPEPLVLDEEDADEEEDTEFVLDGGERGGHVRVDGREEEPHDNRLHKGDGYRQHVAALLLPGPAQEQPKLCQGVVGEHDELQVLAVVAFVDCLPKVPLDGPNKLLLHLGEALCQKPDPLSAGLLGRHGAEVHRYNVQEKVGRVEIHRTRKVCCLKKVDGGLGSPVVHRFALAQQQQKVEHLED